MKERMVVSEKKRSRGLWIGVGVGAAALLAGGAYTAAYFVAGNHVPAKATAGGVAIGGLSPEQAAQKLRDELGAATEQGITLTAGDSSVEILPADAGLAIDYPATVAAAGGGFSWNPVNIWRSLNGGDAVELVHVVDRDKLTQAVAAQERAFAQVPLDAGIAITDGKVVVTKAKDGAKLKVDETATAVEEAFTAGRHEATAAVETVAPAVGDDVVEAFRGGPLNQALTGPVSLTTASGSIDFPEAELAQWLTVEGEAGELSVGVDEAKLTEHVKDKLVTINKAGPKDASYAFSDGKVTVVPGQKGTVIEEKAVVEAFKQAVSGAERTVAVKGVEKEPEFTTAEAEQMKPKEVIGEFTTKYPHAAYRNTNIGTVAKKVNGYVLMPGETFSMNGHVGERTAANGFTDGYVINGGVLVKEPGGGVSQAATTLFNAAFFAGFEDVEHKPHSLYFPRYPAGREATLYYGSVDLKFKNNTQYPAVIQGFINPSSSGKQGSVTFRIWSTKTWDKVTSSDLVKSNFTSGTERVSTAANCEPQAPIQGFTVNYKRLFHKDGKVVKTEPFRWTYQPGDRITCA